MKNFPVIDKETGREYWISRSIAVVIFLVASDKEGNKYILTTIRGTGTPDPEFVGKHCVPCGYLDYDETIVQAAARELKEETGLTIPISDFKLIGFNDVPESDKRQNITFRYFINSQVPMEDLRKLLTSKNSEENEIGGLSFINLFNIESYEWAFNHNELITKLIFPLI
jgi:8-oxo-dGTP diphosphatase